VLVGIRETIEKGKWVIRWIVRLVRLELSDRTPVRAKQRPDLMATALEIASSVCRDRKLGERRWGLPSRDDRQFPDEIVEG
jgi:hypothetical protein